MNLTPNQLLIGILIIITYIGVILFIFKCIYNLYIGPRVNQMTEVYTYDELIHILESICNLHLSIYEEDIFSNKGAITNANFDNFYKELTSSIINSLSPQFFFKMNYYISDEAVVEIICRIVKKYLSKKVNGTT